MAEHLAAMATALCSPCPRCPAPTPCAPHALPATCHPVPTQRARSAGSGPLSGPLHTDAAAPAEGRGGGGCVAGGAEADGGAGREAGGGEWCGGGARGMEDVRRETQLAGLLVNAYAKVATLAARAAASRWWEGMR